MSIHPPDQGERRVALRYPIKIQCGGRKRYHRCIDLSPHGARLAREDDWPVPDEPIRLCFEHHLDHPKEVVAVKVGASRAAVELRFLLLSDVDRLDIAEMLDRASAA